MDNSIERRNRLMQELKALEDRINIYNGELQSLKYGTSKYQKKINELRPIVQEVKVKQTELNTLF